MLQTATRPMHAVASRIFAPSIPTPRTMIETLPFSVRIAQNETDIRKAINIRHAAYARHFPALASKLTQPEAFDFEEGMFVLLAESKLDGAVLGTMRVQTNLLCPLLLEESVELPLKFVGKSLAEATRLGVAPGQVGRRVRIMMFKAMFNWCRDHGIDWMVIAGRAPLDRQYESLMFEDVFPNLGFIPMRHACDIPHRVFAHEIATGQTRWEEAEHPLYDLFFTTDHPDIDIGNAESVLPRIPEFKIAPEPSNVIPLSRYD